MMSSHVALSDIFLITLRACFLVVGMKHLPTQALSECRAPLAGCQESGFSSGREDQVSQFAHGALAAFLLADVVDGFEDVGHGIGWRGRKADGAGGFEIIDVGTAVRELIGGNTVLL